MTPEIRFPGFTGDWHKKRLGDLSIKVGSGSTPRGGSAVYKRSGIPFIRSQNVARGNLNLTDVAFIDERTHASMSNSKIMPNDLLLNITGASLGRTCVVPSDFDEGNVSQHVCIIRLRANVNPFLVHTIFSKPKSLHELLKMQTGGGKEGLNFQAVRAFKVTLPDTDEQRKIAEFLTLIDERISVTDRKIALLKQYKKTVIQRIFTQQIRFKNDDEIDFPDWSQKKLGDVFVGYKGWGLALSQVTENGKNKCILYGELYTRYSEKVEKVYSRTDNVDGMASKANDLLLPCSTTTTGIDLANATALNEDNILLGGDISVLRFKNSGSNVFYAYYLSHFMKNELAAYGQGSTIVHMYFSHYKKLSIIEPHVDEQIKIADFFIALDKQITLLKNKNESLRKLKSSLLQQLFA